MDTMRKSLESTLKGEERHTMLVVQGHVSTFGLLKEDLTYVWVFAVYLCGTHWYEVLRIACRYILSSSYMFGMCMYTVSAG